MPRRWRPAEDSHAPTFLGARVTSSLLRNDAWTTPRRGRMRWLEARHVCGPGNDADPVDTLIDSVESALAPDTLEHAQAHTLLQALRTATQVGQKGPSTDVSEVSIRGALQHLRETQGHDEMAWTRVAKAWPSPLLLQPDVATLVMDSLQRPTTPIALVLQVFLLFLCHEKASSLWSRTQCMPVLVLTNLLEHPHLDKIPLSRRFLFYTKYLDAVQGYSQPLYDETLKTLMHYVFEKRQQPHESAEQRQEHALLGALLLEVRLKQVLRTLWEATHIAGAVRMDESLALVLDLYASRLLHAGLSSPRLLRTIGLAMVCDAVRVANACLLVSSVTHHTSQLRKRFQAQASVDTNEQLFMQVRADFEGLGPPTISPRVWNDVALALGSEEAHGVPRVVCAYVLRALSVISPFHPPPVVEAHQPRSLVETETPTYRDMCGTMTSTVMHIRQAMAVMTDTYVAAMPRVHDTLAKCVASCTEAVTLLSASASPEMASATETLLHTLGDLSYTRFETLHMLWMEHREAALQGAQRYIALFLLVTRSISWALPLTRSSIPLLDDLLHVLCDRNMGLLLPYMPWGYGSPKPVLALWTGMSECMAAMFEQIPHWSRTADRQEMLQWIAQVPRLASFMVQSATLASNSNELQTYRANVLTSLSLPLDSAINWLRLNHEELLQQLSDYIRRTVKLFSTEDCTLPDHVRDHALQFLEQQLSVTRAEERKTLLSTAQMELLLDEFLVLPRRAPRATPKPVLTQQTLPFAPSSATASAPRARATPAGSTSAFQAATHTPALRTTARPAPTSSSARAPKSTGKLAQLRNEFQLTRVAARKPHAPVRTLEPDELPRAPLATSRVTGAVTSVPPRRAPVDSDTTDSSSDEDGGLHSLVSPRQAKPTTTQPRRRVRMMDDPAILAAMHKAEDEKRQRRLRTPPAWAPLHRCLLSWDVRGQDALPPTRLDGTPFPVTHKTEGMQQVSDYTERFDSLLTLEAWAQFQQEREMLASQLRVALTYVRHKRVDDFVHVEYTSAASVPMGYYLSEMELICLVLPTRAVTLTGIVMSATTTSARSQPATLEVEIRVLASKIAPVMPYLHDDQWQVHRFMSLTTLRREYAALKSMPDLGVVQDVLHAHVARPALVSADEVARAAKSYDLNEPQARAVVSVMRTDGFSLVQGPPGTGKTKTIRALVAAFLGKHGTSAQPAPRARMLLCAPSNAAIDELVARLKEGVLVHGKRVFPNLVRLGREDAVHPSVRDVTLESMLNNPTRDTESLEAKKRWQDADAQWKATKAKLRTASSPDEARQLQAAINELADRCFELQEQVQSLASRQRLGQAGAGMQRSVARMSILDKTEIVCTTLTGAGHEMLYRYTYDTVVIDEAAQAVELSTLIPLRYECQRCILVGDPKQLPPTILSQEAEQRGYAKSLFVRMFEKAPAHVHLLSIQYRMHPDISLFPSTAFYNKQLTDGPTMAAKTRMPWHDTYLFGPFRFFHTDAREEGSAGHSYLNRTEARTILEAYAALRHVAGHSLAGQVAFISMYKAQVQCLRSMFVEQYGRDEAENADFSSVDGFQGQEKDIVFLSCVRNNAQGMIGFLSDYRRLNVALTRARSNMLVFGNTAMLSRDTVWRTMIKEAEQRGFVIRTTASTFANPRRGACVPTPAPAVPTSSHAPVKAPPVKAPPVKPPPTKPPPAKTPAVVAPKEIPPADTVPAKRKGDTTAPLRAPPRVVPSTSLLAPPRKPAKWAKIVEKNKQKPVEPPTISAASKRTSSEGPSWLRSARPPSVPRRPS